MGDYSGTVPTILPSDIPSGDDWTAITSYLTAMSAAWTDYSSTIVISNVTPGTGAVTTARYRRVGKSLDYHVKYVLGTAGAMGTGPTFTLPYAPHSSYATQIDPMGWGFLFDAGVKAYTISVRYTSSTTCELIQLGASSIHTGITATSPFTFGVGDGFSVIGSVELA